jgi:hypothetical protein
LTQPNTHSGLIEQEADYRFTVRYKKETKTPVETGAFVFALWHNFIDYPSRRAVPQRCVYYYRS